jgi:UDP-glucose 4-epimerase
MNILIPTKTILLLGGLGYIGSHIAVELLNANYNVVIIDNLSNSRIETLSKIKYITGKDLLFYNKDLLNISSIEEVFFYNRIDGIIHLAGVKSVADSMKDPISYFSINIKITLNILELIKKYNLLNIPFIFSSSATVYGSREVKLHSPFDFFTNKVGFDESSPTNPINPYGKSKLLIEEIIKSSLPSFSILRYFNPIGSHQSGLLGDISPNNLMFAIYLSIKNNTPFNIFGTNYETPDGTAIRDYIHVADLAKAHLISLESLLQNLQNKVPQIEVNKGIYNVGTGLGYSVYQILDTFQKVNNIKLNIKVSERRLGDAESVIANPTKIFSDLNWKPIYNLNDMCRDAFNFMRNLS